MGERWGGREQRFTTLRPAAHSGVMSRSKRVPHPAFGLPGTARVPSFHRLDAAIHRLAGGRDGLHVLALLEELLGSGQEIAVQGEGSAGAGGDFQYVTTGVGHGHRPT